MKALEKIYYRMPTACQNIMVSIKGLQLERTRKRGAYEEYKREILARKDWDATQFEAYQLNELNKLLSHAAENVPYYKTILGPKLCKIDSLQSFTHVPLLSRDKIKANPEAFLAGQVKNKIIVHTTGTTGSPLKIICDEKARQNNYAFFDAYLESLGLKVGARHIIIGGRIVVSPDCSKPPFWRESKFQNSLLMSSYHLAENFFDYYVQKIADYQPEYIESYPSSIYLIARHMMKNGQRLKIKAIITSAETLYPDQREVIEHSFMCKVHDQYGCVEMSFFAGQCPEGNYHLRPDYGIVEILDNDGNPLPLGKTGNVVCTGFINKQMPLIRYLIGDRAAMDEEQTCSCGLQTALLKNICGRKDDVLITGDGRSVGRMSPVLKGLPVKNAQYIQNIPGEVLVNIVPDESFDAEQDVRAVYQAVKLRLGKATKVQIILVPELMKGKGGKLKSVISNVKTEEG